MAQIVPLWTQPFKRPLCAACAVRQAEELKKTLALIALIELL